MFERSRSRRGRHRTALLLAFAIGAIGLVVLMTVAAFGLLSPLADAYFALGTAVLPAAWHDEFQAIPGIVHLAIAAIALASLAGIAGEVLD